MKKIVIKIITIIFTFFAGIVFMSFYYNKGNLDMTAHMAEAALPILYFESGAEDVNPTYGYTAEADASCMRSAIVPLDDNRVLGIALEKYNAEIEKVSYEVRSLDMERLIQNGDAENLEESDGFLRGSIKIKDLLENDEEYLLIFHVKTKDYEDVKYFTRITNCSYELVEACTDFSKEFHDATLDPENDYPITQYLETDNSVKDTTLAYVDIHSKYKTVIWGGMKVTQSQEPVITYLELEDDVAALNLDYQVIYENPDGEIEKYQVKDYFRIRSTSMRVYLLDYERTAERIFSGESDILQEKSLNLGLQWREIPYMSNEEGSVVNFVVSGELWSYDVAQNKLSKVFSFKEGDDKRGLHDEFEIQLVNMEDSGSMDFIVKGYMNRGRHEGVTGTAVMRYDSLTNTTEELLFIESTQCAEVLIQTVGKLLYISFDDQMYLSVAGNVYAVDLNVRNVEMLAENLSSGSYVISRAGDMLAWQHGEDRFSSAQITTMDMKTGVRHTYTAEEGEYLRALAFNGNDFVYGVCRESDVAEDFAGDTLFPMYQVKIVDSSGASIRDFDYSSKNKYVISADVQNNRIDLQCVSKNADGSYAETLAEAITSTEEEPVSAIALSERKDDVKKIEKVFNFEISAAGKMKVVNPKQILFEGSRTITIENTEEQSYHAYGKGKVIGIYSQIREAVMTAYEEMGVVTDQNGNVVWERGGRKSRSVLELADGTEPVAAADSLEASIRLLLEQEGIYADVRSALNTGSSAYEILQQNSKKRPENFTGCNLSSVLYYISNENYVLVMTDADSAEIIVGYDTQNIYVLDPLNGQVTKEGQKDAAERYTAAGNVFFVLYEQ